MKLRIVLFLGFVVAIFGAWHFTQPAPLISSNVENEIHGFGPRLASALEQNSAFDKTANGYQPKTTAPQAPSGLKPQELQAWTAFALKNGSGAALVPTFPEHYSDATRMRSMGMTVALTPLHSNASPAQIENGKLVYHHIYKATDSLNVVSNGRSEEFLLLHDAQAPQQFDYDISGTAGVKNISLTDNTISFTNANGKKLQIEAPYLVESGGKTVPNAVHWELSYPNGDAHPRLSLVVNDANKLRYPVVIDPTFVATNMPMNSARYGHTATLLNSGLVLVTGGNINGYGTGYTNTCELYNPTTGTWATTTHMNSIRYSHTATLLQNGQVLAAGGYNGSTDTATAEVYDPVALTWTATSNNIPFSPENHTATLLPSGQVLIAGGSVNSANGSSAAALYTPGSSSPWAVTGSLMAGRFGHTATLLPNGSVLVTGGTSTDNGSGNELNSSEIYISGSWVYTAGAMKGARSYHTATLLATGKVLVTGGIASTVSIKSCELYNPSTGTWGSTNDMNVACDGATATLLPNGNVLIAGGEITNDGPGTSISTVEVYTTSTGTWATSAMGLTTARRSQTAVLLPSGQILVAGGKDGSNTAVASSELYSTDDNGSWAFTTGNLQVPRDHHTATLLPNGKVLVAGSYDSGALPLTCELYNSATKSWTTTGNLHYGREYPTATLLPNGKVLVAGGFGTNEDELPSAELFDPSGNSGAGSWSDTGSMNGGHAEAAATLLPNGTVLVAGGFDSTGMMTNSSEIYNPSTGSWAHTGNLNVARSSATATLLPNGKVLLVDGEADGDVVASAELYDPNAGTWTLTGSPIAALTGHTATLLPNGRVLVVGGYGYSPTFSYGVTNTAEVYDYNLGTWSPTGSMTIYRQNHAASLLPNGEVLVSAGYGGGSALDAVNILASSEIYNPATGAWRSAGNLDLARDLHTMTVLPNGNVLVAGGHDSGGQPMISSELFNPGLGYPTTTQPSMGTITSVNATTAVSLTGTRFMGVSEASNGSDNSSSSNIPVVQLQSLVNDQVQTLTLDSSTGFSSTSFHALAPTSFPSGYALLTMFVNGTPSTSQIVSYSETTQTDAGFPSTESYSQFSKISFPGESSAGEPISYSIVSGSATLFIYELDLSTVGTVVVAATAPGNGTTTAPFYATETITVTTTPEPFARWCGFFGIAANPNDTPQNDGVANEFKYLCDIDPTVPISNADRAALPTFSIISSSGKTYITLSYRIAHYATAFDGVLQSSPDLASWSNVTAPDYGSGSILANGDTSIQTGILKPTANKYFLRVQVTND